LETLGAGLASAIATGITVNPATLFTDPVLRSEFGVIAADEAIELCRRYAAILGGTLEIDVRLVARDDDGN